MFHVVLHQPDIPQNTGNIGRTCVAVGAKLWLVRPLGFQLDEPRLRRAGLDYWQHLDLQLVSSWQALQRALPDQPFWYFTRHADRDYRQVEYEPESVFVFGSETQGLPATICQPSDERALRIPTTDDVRSLNVSNAVAIVLYEAVRQTQVL